MSKYRKPREKAEVAEPAVTLHFRSGDHYSDWLVDRGGQRAAQIILGVSGQAPPEKWATLSTALLEALADAEDFNQTMAIQAIRAFFNTQGE